MDAATGPSSPNTPSVFIWSPAAHGGVLLFTKGLRTMNEQVEACRRRAFECERKALAATEGELRLLYWQLAGLWRGIARLTADRESLPHEGQMHELSR